MKTVIVALGAALALSACISITPITAQGGPTYELADPSNPDSTRKLLTNPNLDLFSCTGSYLDGYQDYGQCRARYEGTGIVALIPPSCVTVMSKYFVYGAPLGDIGPIRVQVLENGTEHVLAEVADAGKPPWTYWDNIGMDAHTDRTKGVIFTTSGPGTISRGLDVGGNHLEWLTPRIPERSTYSVRVTCATTWNDQTGPGSRTTEYGAYKPI